MTTANHALAGSLIALTVKAPVLVVPLALISHYVLDALPHFGNTHKGLNASQRFRKYLYVELAGALGLGALWATGLYGWNLITLAAIVAILPDAEWPIRYFAFERHGKKPPATFTATFHKKIQRLEREWGVAVEIVFFVAGYVLLSARV